jgi:excisionase family DNA binding protein
MAGADEFDPMAYIESGFLDADRSDLPKASVRRARKRSVRGPVRFRKTELSAPRPRRAEMRAPDDALGDDLRELLTKLPRNLEFLGRFFDDDVTAHYYQGDFKESREELIRRLVDPELNLEEASRLLGVCPSTVRRYTNREWLEHHRTKGGQRRFRLSNIVNFLETHGRFPEG